MKKLIISLITLLFITGCDINLHVITDDFEVVKDDEEVVIDLRAGATVPSTTYTYFINDAEGIGDPNNCYMILANAVNGDMVNATTGAVTSVTTWTNAAIVGAIKTYNDDTDNSKALQFTIPTLDNNYTYCMTILEEAVAGTPASTDESALGGWVLYNPNLRIKTYTDTMPVLKGKVQVEDKTR